MGIKNTTQGYGLIAILLHWLMAVVIIGLFTVGLWMTELNYYSPWYKTAPDWHKSVGILLFGLWGLRLIWRAVNTRPHPLASHKNWEKALAAVTHVVIYCLILLVVISGYMISTADGRAVSVFGWFEIPAVTTGIDNQEDIAGEFHFYLACSLIGLAGLHAGAALKHHFLDKDSTLKRMINAKFSSTGE